MANGPSKNGVARKTEPCFVAHPFLSGSAHVLKSQVGLLVGGLGFAAGALALPALRWEHRPRRQMKIGQHVRYQRIGEGLAAIPALQKPFCHRLKIPRFSTKSTGSGAYATENFRSKNLLQYCPTRCQVAVIRFDLAITFILTRLSPAKAR
jgi:hypothetical protein